MEAYLKRHEAWILGLLASADEGFDWAALARFHRTQIDYMQHERLIHLLVTLFFGICTLLTLLVVVFNRQAPLTVLLLLLLFLALLVPYIAHYYKLENGVQRWYHLANKIEQRAGHVSGP
jgi:cell division protein FtsW (lipid II flippase)